MRVCVFGLGSIGSLLAEAIGRVDGIHLSGVARGAHLDVIQEHGLRILREHGETTTRMKVAADPATLGKQDLVFNCLKAHQSWESAESIAKLLHADTSVVTCQNGVPWWYFHQFDGHLAGTRLDSADRDNRQWNTLGPERIIGCTVYPAAEIAEPGVIRHIHGDRLVLGEPDGAVSKRVQQVSRLLQRGGIDAPIAADIRSEIWLKLWGNVCFNPISVLTRATLGEIAGDPDVRRFARHVMEEARRVGEAAGATFRANTDARIDRVQRIKSHRSSMLQDLESGRPMEIDAIVATVCETGRLTGIPTPTIDGMLSLVRLLGRTHGTYPTYPAEGLANQATP